MDASLDRLRSRERWIVALGLIGIIAFALLPLAWPEALDGAKNLIQGSAQLKRCQAPFSVSLSHPPVVAIVLLPLTHLPLDVSALLLYFGALGLALVVIHSLASALQNHSGDPKVRHQVTGRRRWWMLRVVALCVCVVPLGFGLLADPLVVLVVACLIGFLIYLVAERSFEAGLCLAAAGCVDVYTLAMIVLPLWRRDIRCFVGIVFGVAAGMVLAPSLYWDTQVAWDMTASYVYVCLIPAWKVAAYPEWLGPISFVRELLGQKDDLWLLASWASVVVMAVAATLLAAPRRLMGTPLVVQASTLCTLIAALNPASGRHGVVLTLPLLMGLIGLHWEFRKDLVLPGRVVLAMLLSVATTIAANVVQVPFVGHPGALTFSSVALCALSWKALRDLGEQGGLRETAALAWTGISIKRHPFSVR